MWQSIIENLLVMVLTIAVLLGSLYMLLLVLQWWLKLKTRGREEEGLSNLWQSTHLKQPGPDEDDGADSP